MILFLFAKISFLNKYGELFVLSFLLVSSFVEIFLFHEGRERAGK